VRRQGSLAVAVLAFGAGAAWALAQGRPVPTDPHAPTPAPVVRVAAPPRGTHRVIVRAQGTVEPPTVSDLVAEVSGRVTWVSPALAAGGFFEEGDLLLEIDRADYDNGVRQARAARDRADAALALEKAEFGRAVALAERDVASASALDRRRHAERSARAALEETRAALDRARRDLDRTHLRAPFAGRVRRTSVDVGQFVARGAPLASLFAVDFAEVRLPVRDDDLAFLDLTLGYRDEAEARPLPAVTLRGRHAGASHAWRGRIVRTEGEIDARSRMLHLVARVEDPYGRRDARPPLAVGMFVAAEIEGHVLEDVLELPRAALRADDRILVVDPEDRIRLRPVEVLRRDGERVIARASLAPGERLCLSRLEPATDGMRVRPLETGSAPDPTQLAGSAP
jgi:RND family efflux transporter MFP subunit